MDQLVLYSTSRLHELEMSQGSIEFETSMTDALSSVSIRKIGELLHVELRHVISIIIPVFNEETQITGVLKGITEVLNGKFQNYEIIVINDGSVDKTLEVIQELQRLDSHIRVLSYERNMGKGYAVRIGVLNSIGDIVLYLDGDLNISPMEIAEYMKQLDSYDIVIASKTHPMSIVTAPTGRKFLSKMFNLLVRLLTGINLRDTQSGLKAGRGSALRAIFKKMVVRRYAFDVELLAIASALDLKIKELPIIITLDCSFKILEIIKMLFDILQISYRINLTKQYQKVMSV
jgi:dolichol-phosphate mannosyltransferase